MMNSRLIAMCVGILAGMAFASIYGYVGNGDYKQALKDQRDYCTNVEAGIWPDYQKNYEKVCKKSLTPKA